MRKMNHHHFMKLIDSYEDENELYLVTDLKADNLRNVLNDNYGPLEGEFAKKVFR